MQDIQQIWDGVSHVAFGLIVIATVIVRLTPTKSDDKKLDEFLKKLHKFMAYFPTVGRNPRTKELEKKEEKNVTPS